MGRMREGLMMEVQQELKDKEAKLVNLERQFSHYKKTLMAELKEEIASHDTSLKRGIREYASSPSARTSDKAYLTEEAKRQAEARKEACERLDNLQQKVLKLRTFYNLKLFIKKEKYRGKIDLLRDTITRNAQSHGNLSLAERREFILKQELVHAQESMAGIERVLRKMQTTLKEKNETLMKFNQANNARAHKMIELEAKVKKYADADKSDILDAQKAVSYTHLTLPTNREV
eukprot:TRINITY_DN16440_c0_g1_i3.p1 TRINITY_DN16440_c0_g1~~TRINITY_DN16440_c0_g1_i3.p1  ORF type:complete len:246 (+),score=68.29 TRINITY_DN16440_c0_g1_i3:45-740(+)